MTPRELSDEDVPVGVWVSIGAAVFVLVAILGLVGYWIYKEVEVMRGKRKMALRKEEQLQQVFGSVEVDARDWSLYTVCTLDEEGKPVPYKPPQQQKKKKRKKKGILAAIGRRKQSDFVEPKDMSGPPGGAAPPPQSRTPPPPYEASSAAATQSSQ